MRARVAEGLFVAAAVGAIAAIALFAAGFFEAQLGIAGFGLLCVSFGLGKIASVVAPPAGGRT